MSRRPRRSGVNFIENDKDRNLTYFKRCSGLYKSAADLSTLTGAKIAIVVEAESGKKSAFGTPSANNIIDSFLSEHNPNINEGEMTKITHLQNELFRQEKDKAVDDKRARKSKACLKAIQDTLGIDQLVSSEKEDLGGEELNELLQRLTRVGEDINNHQANLGQQHEVSSQSGLLTHLSSSLWHSQIKIPPRQLPWVYLQPSSLLHQTSLPSAKAPSMQQLHQQAHMMSPLPNETHQYNHYFPQPQPPMLPLQVELPLNPMAPLDPNHAYTNNFSTNPVPPPYENNAYSHNFVASQQSASYQWNPVTPSNEPYYDPSLHALSDYFELDDHYGGQAAAGGPEDELDPSGLHAQADDDWLAMNLFDSPLHGENLW
ncbi:hypothetical protein EJB05_51001, partial [Eragrostis curvula]